MINFGDLYSVLTAVVPLYVTMFLAYASVKWNIFSPQQCGGINRFVAIFAVPLLSFEFISRINPYKMNLKFIAADGVSKVLTLIVLFLWTNLSKKGSLDWAITMFSLSTLPNTLVMGIPLLKSMYGDDKESIMVQAVVLQSPGSPEMLKKILKMVCFKLVKNPNSYASILGLSWALASCRWGIKKPQILENSVTILSDAGLGMAMFSLGLFMASQPKLIACGNRLAAYGMVARFVAGPAVMAVASIAVGLRGTILQVSIVQASLPQGIVPFVFSREYNLHPDIGKGSLITCSSETKRRFDEHRFKQVEEQRVGENNGESDESCGETRAVRRPARAAGKATRAVGSWRRPARAAGKATRAVGSWRRPARAAGKATRAGEMVETGDRLE
ncbi:Auxin efflux carrier, partial [Cynara cardunculus var. scolymus]